MPIPPPPPPPELFKKDDESKYQLPVTKFVNWVTGGSIDKINEAGNNVEREGGSLDSLAKYASTGINETAKAALPVMLGGMGKGAQLAYQTGGKLAAGKLLAKTAGEMGLGIAAQEGVTKASKALGAGEGVSELAGTAAGLIPFTSAGRRVYKSLRGEKPIGLDINKPDVTVTPSLVEPPKPPEELFKVGEKVEPRQMEMPLVDREVAKVQKRPMGREVGVVEGELEQVNKDIQRSKPRKIRLREEAKLEQKEVNKQDPQMSLFVSEPNEVNGPVVEGQTPKVGLGDRQSALDVANSNLDHTRMDVRNDLSRDPQQSLFPMEEKVSKAEKDLAQPNLETQAQGSLVVNSEVRFKGTARDQYKAELINYRNLKKKATKLKAELNNPPTVEAEQGVLWTDGEIKLDQPKNNPEADYYSKLRDYAKGEEYKNLPNEEKQRILKSLKTLGKMVSPQEMQKIKLGYARARASVDPKAKPIELPNPTGDPVVDYALSRHLLSETRRIELEKSTLGQKWKKLKANIVDYFSPIEDLIAPFEDRLLPSQNITNKFDTALRADNLAYGFIEKEGLKNIIQSVDKKQLPLLDQYLRARHMVQMKDSGSFNYYNSPHYDYDADKALVDKFHNSYEGLAQGVTEFSNKVIKHAVDRGLISGEDAAKMLEMYPSYVTLNRLMPKSARGAGEKGVSMTRQSTIKPRLGGEEPFDSPLQAVVDHTIGIFKEGERNEVAKTLAGYAGFNDSVPKLDGFDKIIKEVKASGPGDGANQFSYLDNGKRRVFETTPEIATAARMLEREKLGGFFRLINLAAQTAKRGITGANPVFAVVNLQRDLGTAFINSPGRMNYVKEMFLNAPKAIMETFNMGKLYKELEARGALGSSFDVYRSNREYRIDAINAARNSKENFLFKISHPKELFRAYENFLALGEEATRMQQWLAAHEDSLAKGLPEGEAKIAADRAARETTANFWRSGNYGPAVNSLWLYMNAGIQGSRASVRAAMRDPMGFSVKYATGIILPILATTQWNLSDPKRAEIYSDLRDYIKENNLILVLPSAYKDPQTGKLKHVVTIPLPPGISRGASMLRRTMESAIQIEPKALDYFKDIVDSVLPVSPISKDTISSLIPQFIKPAADIVYNKDSYTQVPIVPENKLDKPLSQRTNKNTTSLAKGISKASQFLNMPIAPAQVQHLSEGYLGRFPFDVASKIADDVTVTGPLAPLSGLGKAWYEGTGKRYVAPFGGGRRDRYKSRRESFLEEQ